MKPSITPNAAEKRWLEAVADFATEYGDAVLFQHAYQIHHICGRAYVQDRVHIGHYFISAYPTHLHDVSSNHEHNVTHYRKAFVQKYGTERGIFEIMVERMRNKQFCDKSIFPPEEALKAIQNTRY